MIPVTETLKFREALSVEVSEAAAVAGIAALRAALEAGLAPVFAYNAAAAAVYGPRYTEALSEARNGLLVDVVNALTQAGVYDLLSNVSVRLERRKGRG